MKTLERHYGYLLELTKDWQVVEVQLKTAEQRVEILVEWKNPKRAPCPQCGKRCGIYDKREERHWRHLDTMQFERRICCRLPRCQCPEHGVHTVGAVHQIGGTLDRPVARPALFVAVGFEQMGNLTALGLFEAKNHGRREC